MKKLGVRLTWSPANSMDVGTLAERDRRIFFEYAESFLQAGLELSPFRLPARAGLQEHTARDFGPLPGLFDDSLPDGWGLLLMDRHFRRQGLEFAAISMLDRLAYLGANTMGALTYHPHDPQGDARMLDLDVLGRNAERVYEGEAEEVLPELLRAGGSPAGARPKVLVGLHGTRILSGEGDLPEGFSHWLVKFSSRQDARNAGPAEYAYSLMARAAGIDVPETRLLEAGRGRKARRYFAVKRFDRGPGNARVHVHTLANLIEVNFRIPSTDYSDLFGVTRALTRNHRDVLRVFRMMVFNVATHNRDDHAKNFAFLMDSKGEWSLSPAYDITYSAGPGGEHSMSLLGEGRNPTREHCLELAAQVGLRAQEAAAILEAVNSATGRWSQFADEAGCPMQTRLLIASRLSVL